jgi:hypothetical protein
VGVHVYALIDLSLPEPIAVYVQREDAERTLAELLHDEPGWRTLLSIAEIALSAPAESEGGFVAR